VVKIGVTKEFRPRRRIKEFIFLLVLSYSVVLNLVFSLPLNLDVIISCLIITLFVTLSLTMYHRALAERRITVGLLGIKLNKGKRFMHVPWAHVLGVKEYWMGYGKERHRRFYLVTSAGELELLRDGEYENADAVISAIVSYKKETVST